MIYLLVMTISLCFSMLLLVIYDNDVTPYHQSYYDYSIYWLDNNTIDVLKKNKHIKELYYDGIYCYDMYYNNKSAHIDMIYVPYWDVNGLTVYSDKRKVKGNLSDDKNSIMIDALLARELNVDVGEVVYINNNGKEIPFKVCIIIEPFESRMTSKAVCVCNDYVERNMGVSKENLLCSEMFLKTDGSKEIEDYLFYEYVPPECEKYTKEKLHEVDLRTVYKKEWEIESAKEELEHTPPVTICISLLALVIIFIFVLREATSQKINNDKDIAILESIGMKRKVILPVTMIGQLMIIIPAIGLSSFLVKKIYDRLITNYYLSYRLIVMEAVILLIASIFICFIVSLIVVIKNKKKSICELLNAE